MHLIDLLGPARVVAGAKITSKKRLLELLARLLAEGQLGDGNDSERRIFESLCSREKLGSTALGHGIAIPHGRSDALTAASGCFVQLDQPIDFGAPDGQPVDLLFAMAVPEHFTHQHLLLLSQLAEMFSDPNLSARLRASRDATTLFAQLADWHPASAVAA
ncbi:MAG: PTS sugar transporter subunit IIA [Pseudomarimonas sp.]